MAMRWGRPMRAVTPRVIQGVVEHDQAVPPNGSVPGGVAVQAHSGAAPSALMLAVAATAGFTPATRHGEAMQALGRALAEEGREADAIAALRRAVLAFRDSGDRARLARALTDSGGCLHRDR